MKLSKFINSTKKKFEEESFTRSDREFIADAKKLKNEEIEVLSRCNYIYFHAQFKFHAY